MKDKIDQAIKSGELFFLGNKLPEDFYSAFIEWKNLAEVNQDPKAYYNLAYCFRYGEGVEADINASVKSYRSALDNGIEKAASKLYDCFGSYLKRSINLFNPETTIEDSENYKKTAISFLRTINMLVEKGYSQYTNKIAPTQKIIDVLDLHISYLQGRTEFTACAESLKKRGLTWAPDLVRLMDCQILKVYTYTEEREMHSVIKDGNSSYINGSKYHDLKIADYIVNNNNSKCYLYYPEKYEIEAKQRVLIREDKYPQKATPNHDTSNYRNIDSIPFIELIDINKELGINTSVKAIKPTLSVIYEVREKSLAMRPGNIISFLGAAAFVGMCLYFAMH